MSTHWSILQMMQSNMVLWITFLHFLLKAIWADLKSYCIDQNSLIVRLIFEGHCQPTNAVVDKCHVHFKKPHMEGPLPLPYVHCLQYKIYQDSKLSLSTIQGDNCCEIRVKLAVIHQWMQLVIMQLARSHFRMAILLKQVQLVQMKSTSLWLLALLSSVLRLKQCFVKM